MRGSVAQGVLLFVVATLVACGGAQPPPSAAPAGEEHDGAPDEPLSVTPVTSVDAPERTAPPSTKSYAEALATPERLDVHDERMHLTDGQLTGPIRGVLSGCRVASNARVTIRTAVQYGRAIGVTVSVRFEHPGASRPPSRAVARAEAKMSAKIVACADRAVRAAVWPPSSRRDSFTTQM